MSAPTTTKAHIVKKQPTDHVVLSGPDATWAIEEKPLPELKDGQLLTELVYLSNDPAQRAWMDANQDPERLYTDPVKTGDAMRCICVQKVIESKDSKFKSGDLVNGYATWSQYNVIDAKGVQPVKTLPGLSPTHYLGALGGPGLTAYMGLTRVGEAKKGESLVVSGAAGATGSMVVQIAKHILGLSKVIGLAGTDEKCRWVESLGADKCINYKKDWKTELHAATEGFVDLYFDNVGGEVMDFMLTRLSQGGRAMVCGAISGYNDAQSTMVLTNWMNVILMRIQLKGFIVTDHAKHFPEAIETMVKAYQEGKIKIDGSTETVVETKFEDIPKTFVKLFEGGNQGKLITKLI